MSPPHSSTYRQQQCTAAGAEYVARLTEQKRAKCSVSRPQQPAARRLLATHRTRTTLAGRPVATSPSQPLVMAESDFEQRAMPTLEITAATEIYSQEFEVLVLQLQVHELLTTP